MSRLAEIFTKTLEKSGTDKVVGTAGLGGALKTTLKERAKEVFDPRNILFSGDSIGAAVGRKIFGKGYSAIDEEDEKPKRGRRKRSPKSSGSPFFESTTPQREGAQTKIGIMPQIVNLLDQIKQTLLVLPKIEENTKETNKILEEVLDKFDGIGTTSNFFKTEDEKEAALESSRKSTISPVVKELREIKEILTKMGDPKKKDGGGLLGLGSLLQMLTRFGSILKTGMLALAKFIPALLAFLTSPAGLALLGGLAAAGTLAFLKSKNDEAYEKEFKPIADKKARGEQLTAEEEKKLKENPAYVSKYSKETGFDVQTGKKVEKPKTNRQAGAENQRQALKQLQPGTAAEMLKAGPQAYDGYTKQELEAYAAGKTPPPRATTPSAVPGAAEAKPPAAGGGGSAGEAMNFFMSKGWTKEQAAGIVGNLQAESGNNLKIDAVGDGGKAYGIAQWHPDRQAQFKNVYGKDIRQASFQEQLEFVNWELNNTEKRAGNKLREATTAGDAAAIVDKFYERSSGAHLQKRIANANALAGGETQTGAATPESPSASGSKLQGAPGEITENQTPQEAAKTLQSGAESLQSIYDKLAAATGASPMRVMPQMPATMPEVVRDASGAPVLDASGRPVLQQVPSPTPTPMPLPGGAATPGIAPPGAPGAGTTPSPVPSPGSAMGANGQFHPMGGYHRVTSKQGMRIHPITGKETYHPGVDLGGRKPGVGGDAVYSMQDGVVESVNSHGDVTIRNKDGSKYQYLHVEGSLKPGDKVTGGQQIAVTKQTDSRSTAPHLDIRGTDANGQRLDMNDILEKARMTGTKGFEEQATSPQPVPGAEQTAQKENVPGKEESKLFADRSEASTLETPSQAPAAASLVPPTPVTGTAVSSVSSEVAGATLDQMTPIAPPSSQAQPGQSAAPNQQGVLGKSKESPGNAYDTALFDTLLLRQLSF